MEPEPEAVVHDPPGNLGLTDCTARGCEVVGIHDDPIGVVSSSFLEDSAHEDLDSRLPDLRREAVEERRTGVTVVTCVQDTLLPASGKASDVKGADGDASSSVVDQRKRAVLEGPVGRFNSNPIVAVEEPGFRGAVDHGVPGSRVRFLVGNDAHVTNLLCRRC
jgi:hypothetical protein